MKPGSAPCVPIVGATIRGTSVAAAVCEFDIGVAAGVVCAGRAESAHAVMMMVIRLIINNDSIFLYISFSILAYFIVHLLGKNRKIGMWKFGLVDGLRVKVRPAWKRQIVQQVGAVSEQCALLVFGGKALVYLGKGRGGAVTDLGGVARDSSLTHCSSVRGKRCFVSGFNDGYF